MKKEKRITLVLLIIYLIILTWIILLKTQFSFSALGHFRSVNVIPFAESVVINGKMDLDEIMNNFIVFIPVGLYIGMMMPEASLLKKTAPAFGLSLCYEVIQFIFAIGASDITDVIMNTLGGAAGVLLIFLISKVLKDKTIKILNIAAIICTAAVVAFMALLIGLNNLF